VDLRCVPAFVRREVKEADGLEVIESHELLDTLANPNPFHTGSDLMNLMVETRELGGEMYWWLNETPKGLEIWPLPLSWVRPEHAENNLLYNYKVWPLDIGGEACSFPGDQRLSAANRVHCRCACLSITTFDED
jgi:hypothetical protein